MKNKKLNDAKCAIKMHSQEIYGEDFVRSKVAIKAVSLAAQPDWNYPDENEYPKIDGREIIVVEWGSEKPKCFHVPNESYRNFKVDFRNKFIAWCELPTYK